MASETTSTSVWKSDFAAEPCVSLAYLRAAWRGAGSARFWICEDLAHPRSGLSRPHSNSTVETDDLSIQLHVFKDVLDQKGEVGCFPEALGEWYLADE